MRQTQRRLESSRTSTMELFTKTLNHFKPLTIFAKSSTLNFPMGLEYASENDSNFNPLQIRVHQKNVLSKLHSNEGIEMDQIN